MKISISAKVIEPEDDTVLESADAIFTELHEELEDPIGSLASAAALLLEAAFTPDIRDSAFSAADMWSHFVQGLKTQHGELRIHETD